MGTTENNLVGHQSLFVVTNMKRDIYRFPQNPQQIYNAKKLNVTSLQIRLEITY
jgi:hypothetical protein